MKSSSIDIIKPTANDAAAYGKIPCTDKSYGLFWTRIIVRPFERRLTNYHCFLCVKNVGNAKERDLHFHKFHSFLFQHVIKWYGPKPPKIMTKPPPPLQVKIPHVPSVGAKVTPSVLPLMDSILPPPDEPEKVGNEGPGLSSSKRAVKNPNEGEQEAAETPELARQSPSSSSSDQFNTEEVDANSSIPRILRACEEEIAEYFLFWHDWNREVEEDDKEQTILRTKVWAMYQRMRNFRIQEAKTHEESPEFFIARREKRKKYTELVEKTEQKMDEWNTECERANEFMKRAKIELAEEVEFSFL